MPDAGEVTGGQKNLLEEIRNLHVVEKSKNNRQLWRRRDYW
jgi:hypothetical protein